MKMIKISVVFVCLMLGVSCTLDLQQNPNTVDPSQAIPDLLLNSMQRQLAGLFQGASSTGMTLTRLQNAGNSTYANTISPNGFDGTWSTAYAGILLDGNTLIAQADKDGFARHAGMTRVMNAYVLLMLVDMFGDVPYSKAFGGASQFNPSVDPGLSVYTAAIAMLDKGILDLTTLLSNATPTPGYLNPVAPTPPDQYYYGNFGNWVRLANTLKLKAFLNLRLTDLPGATTGINAVLAHPGGLITAQGQSFMFHYGSNTADPDARHPRFIANYPSGGGNYMSNWLMWQMIHGYDAVQQGGIGDPRLRFYFYRQTGSNNTDPNNIRCVTNLLAPAHYPQVLAGAISITGPLGHPAGISTDPLNAAWTSSGAGSAGTLPKTFCYPSLNGYWGRDHVDAQGIPPDNFLRTAWGAYPAGGRFDGATQTGVGSNIGMRGAGIQPIMMRCFTEFMLAEAVLTMPGIVGASPAATHFANGINASFTDVRDFSLNGTMPGSAQPAGPNESATITGFYSSANYTANVNTYLNRAAGVAPDKGGANVQYAAASATEKLNLIAREYWIASFGNGVEAYNLYRRTGFPSGMQPTLQATVASAPFPRSYYYPQAFAALNSSVTQKTVLSQRVFWDTNTANLDF
ncbi:MAG: SusD/RagB family nutrient-binding outer membrane lipoprotein [Cytophagales bacterium]|nr:SusD/RagB family nutrient-binding outer membrane lipoprotein [Cytophagales bacterium]